MEDNNSDYKEIYMPIDFNKSYPHLLHALNRFHLIIIVIINISYYIIIKIIIKIIIIIIIISLLLV